LAGGLADGWDGAATTDGAAVVAAPPKEKPELVLVLGLADAAAGLSSAASAVFESFVVALEVADVLLVVGPNENPPIFEDGAGAAAGRKPAKPLASFLLAGAAASTSFSSSSTGTASLAVISNNSTVDGFSLSDTKEEAVPAPPPKEKPDTLLLVALLLAAPKPPKGDVLDAACSSALAVLLSSGFLSWGRA
jgi:hypothetical protein